ncbi:hypothetical protein SEUCBS139899_010127 [Sporothrix eucalyptigena]|uniref:AT hook domain-containing protein n=1 Tax=Sporothrix eucalyptigena TaxID=1812306 RepID=A0ABP0CZS3_9PEZI
MPPKAAAAQDDASKTHTSRPAQEDTAKITKTGKGSGKRGRPKMDPALRKTQVYVPTGRPRGRPPKDPSQKKAPAAPKVPSTPGAGRGRGRPAGSTKKAATSAATAVASVAAAVSAAKSTPGKRGRKSKATLEAERLEKEAAKASDDDDDSSDADANGVDADDDEDSGES